MVGMSVDLVASRMCELKVLDPASGLSRAVLLPGSATVLVDGHTIRIPEGQTRTVASSPGKYELVDHQR